MKYLVTGFFGSKSQMELSSCKHLRFFGCHLNSRHANVLLWFLKLFCSPHSLAFVGLFKTTFWWSTTVHCPQIPSFKFGKTSSWRFLRFYKDKFFLYRKIILKKTLKWAVLDETRYSLHLHKFEVVLVLAKFFHLFFLSSFNMMSYLFFSCTFL